VEFMVGPSLLKTNHAVTGSFARDAAVVETPRLPPVRLRSTALLFHAPILYWRDRTPTFTRHRNAMGNA
jgi:hypothetical protein